MSNKNEPITLEEVMGCSALKSIILQVMVKSTKKNPSQPIELFIDDLMKEEGMQAYIHRLGYQIQSTLRDRGDQEDSPF